MIFPFPLGDCPLPWWIMVEFPSGSAPSSFFQAMRGIAGMWRSWEDLYFISDWYFGGTVGCNLGFPCCSKMQVPKEGRQFLHPGLQGSWLGGGFNPSEQYENQWEGWHPIHEMEKTCIKNVPNHQPVDDSIHLMLQIPFGNWFMLSWWMTSITETSPA